MRGALTLGAFELQPAPSFGGNATLFTEAVAWEGPNDTKFVPHALGEGAFALNSSSLGLDGGASSSASASFSFDVDAFGVATINGASATAASMLTFMDWASANANVNGTLHLD